MNLHPPLTDVAVLFIFFTRTKQTQAVFEQIKRARPSKLFLYQDGARPGREDDKKYIAECREIVEQIDWQCDVHRWYQTENVGCDPSEYLSQKWMFSMVDKGIVLEDDDVPSQSFFPFCKELLDKYEHDERINIICGMNNLGTIESPYSYIFSQYGSIWGWATWKRNIDRWDPDYQWLNDECTIQSLSYRYRHFDKWIKTCRRHLASGRAHYESILAAQARLNNQLNIIPTRNMITNIGISEETTHSVNDISKLSRATRKLLYMQQYEIGFPLKHPQYVVEDIAFKNRFERLCVPSGFVQLLRKCESRLYRIFPFLGRL